MRLLKRFSLSAKIDPRTVGHHTDEGDWSARGRLDGRGSTAIDCCVFSVRYKAFLLYAFCSGTPQTGRVPKGFTRTFLAVSKFGIRGRGMLRTNRKLQRYSSFERGV